MSIPHGEPGTGVRRNAQEVDLTLDYKIRQGWLESFWLRLRGSWLREEGGRATARTSGSSSGTTFR